ncbi:hypothetical protein ILYODFUR_015301 [Ilyodon furcidens]|uniref:Uncharacterized protein n=1 Tax=Ilyodon furcidens TaxID=33524 RepID=A0ABV0TIW7_9TELE
MLTRHHNENTGNQKEAESDVHVEGCQCWALHTSPLLASPVILECSICSGPYISYAMEETWQPRQRTQAMDLYYHNESEPDSYCCRGDRSKYFAINPVVLLLQFLLFLSPCSFHLSKNCNCTAVSIPPIFIIIIYSSIYFSAIILKLSTVYSVLLMQCCYLLFQT